MTDPEKRTWLARVITVNAALLLIVAYILIGFGASWASNMWEHRARIYESDQARCDGSDAHCAKQDLPAQIRAATAAEAMVDISIWQLIIGTAGLIAVAGTLWVNARAVGHASRQAAAAELQLANADRPHMLLDFVSIGHIQPLPQPEHLVISFTWKNWGRGVGWTTRYSATFGITNAGDTADFTGATPSTTEIAWPVPPGGFWQITPEANLRTPLKNEIIMGVLEKRLQLYVALSLCYQDSGGRDLETRMVCLYEPDNDRLIPVANPYARTT